VSQGSEVHFLLPGSIIHLGGYTFSACGNALTTFVIGSESNPLDFSKLFTDSGHDFKGSDSGYKSIVVTISDSSLYEAALQFFSQYGIEAVSISTKE
jgi:hypothetical protein